MKKYKNIIDRLPKSHFGSSMDKTVNLLLTGESVCVYGVPGCGRKYFIKKAISLLQKKDEDLIILFLEGQVYPKDIKKVIRQTIKKELKIEDEYDFFQEVYKKLKTKRLVIVLGHLESVINTQKSALRLLLKLRNLCSPNISVLTSCDHTLLSKKENYLKTCKTLLSTQIILPPFDLKGATTILDTNREHFGFKYPKTAYRKISILSGGNASLIKHLGKAVDDLGERILDDKKTLINHPSVRMKLDDLADVILKEDEEILKKLGILKGKGLFSPLLSLYFKNFELKNIDALFPYLTSQEKKIFTFFLKNKGKLIDKDRINFLMGLTEEEFSLWAVYKAISRLKEKVKQIYEIKNLKGQGYILKTVN